nr:TRAP transporter large permease [Syntrophomonas palmitatica]
MTPVAAGLIGIFLFFALIILGMPIAYGMAMVGFAGFAYLTSFPTAMNMVARDLFGTFSSYSLSVIAMFVWMGFLAYYSGIGSRLYIFAYRLIGHWPGGLAIATQTACAVFGAICGSNTATAATMGAIALPEMKKYKYDDSIATASVAAGGVLGVLIPPSVIFIVYGMATEQSIGKLFIAGILPGILLMFLYQLTIIFLTWRNPQLGPPGPKTSWQERVEALNGGLWEVLIVFLISMGGLFAGFFTPTEAGAVGAFGVLLAALLGKQITWEGFKKSLLDSTRTTVMIMLMVAGAMVFGRFMAISRLPYELASWTAGMNLPSWEVMAVIIFIYLILGCFIDALALVLLTIPIFYPIAVGTWGMTLYGSG